jgi:hypothetical protein
MNEEQKNEDNKEQEILTLEEKLNIINTFHTDLKNIDLKQETIERISSYIREKIEKYGDYLTFEIFQILESETHFTPRLEYLYIINDIIIKYKDIKQNQINKIYPYIKNICCYSYTTLNDNFREKIRELINLWKTKEIFSQLKMKELEFELKMQIEPELTEDKDEINFLLNLNNNGSIKFDQNLINFSKELETLERTKDNKHRKTLLKMEKDIITKQFKIYNSQIQHLKEIDLILDKIKTFNEIENSSLKEKDLEKKSNKEINNDK